MRHRNLLRPLSYFLILILLTVTLNASARDAATVAIIDPLTGDRYEDAPPAELLKDMGREETHDALKTWVGLDTSLKARTRAYFNCKEKLGRLEDKLAKAENEKTIKLVERNKRAKTLKKMLVAALGRLGLQTAVIIADGTTDVQLALKKLNDTTAKNLRDIKNARKNAAMMSEFDRLSRKAAAGRRLLQQAEVQLNNVMRQIEQARLKKGFKAPKIDSHLISEKGFKLKPMEKRYIRNDDLMQIKYFSSSKRENYRITIKDGKMYDAEGKLFDTSDSIANMRDGHGRAIFIMDGKGNFYYYKDPSIMVTHHSSLNFGAPVAAAGEIKVIQGMLQYINNQSGHYLPSMEYMKQAERWLESLGFDMKRVDVEYIN